MQISVEIEAFEDESEDGNDDEDDYNSNSDNSFDKWNNVNFVNEWDWNTYLFICTHIFTDRNISHNLLLVVIVYK